MARMPVQISPRCRWRKQQGARARLLENLEDKMVSLINNGRLNFPCRVGDLETQLEARCRMKTVKKHRNPGDQPDSSRAHRDRAAQHTRRFPRCCRAASSDVGMIYPRNWC